MKFPLGIATLACWAARASAQNAAADSLLKVVGQQQNLSSFADYVKKYPEVLDLLGSGDKFTVLAPDNQAFDKIPFGALNDIFFQKQKDGIDNALSYHIVKGEHKTSALVPGVPYNLATFSTSPQFTNVTGGQRVTNIKQSGDVVVYVSGLGTRSEVKKADIAFDAGVIQVISSPIIPPANITVTTKAYNLTSFQGAAFAANRMAELSSAKDITILAPMNEAFQALGPAIANMTAAQLSKVLDYHIIPDKLVFSTDIKNGTKLTAANGKTITVQQIGNMVYLNSAQLITKDILIANGVIHTLDNVLNPDDAGPGPDPEKATQSPVFSSATAVPYIPFTSAIPCSTDCPVTKGTATNAGISASKTGTTAAATSTSKAAAAALARETGFPAAGLLAMIGGAVMMI